MRPEKILREKITHPRLKNQIVGPLLVALHAECYNILLLLPSMQHSFHQFNRLFYLKKKTKENKL